MTTTTTIRISRDVRDMLKTLADTSGDSMQNVLEEAILAYRDSKLLEATNAAYAALKDNDDAWKLLLEERAEWDETLNDGLEEA